MDKFLKLYFAKKPDTWNVNGIFYPGELMKMAVGEFNESITSPIPVQLEMGNGDLVGSFEKIEFEKRYYFINIKLTPFFGGLFGILRREIMMMKYYEVDCEAYGNIDEDKKVLNSLKIGREFFLIKSPLASFFPFGHKYQINHGVVK